MKNKLIIITALFIINMTQVLAYTRNANTTQQSYAGTKKVNNHPKANKPTYYQGHSDGLQNYPGKTIDAGMNTGMLPTNSASHSGNDVTF